MGAQLQSCGRICWRDGSAAQQASGSGAVAGSCSLAASAGIEEGHTAGNRYLFPDFGGAAPICPPPPRKQSCGPITLDVLQGDWYSGNGSQIAVMGTVVHLNGLPLREHRVELDEDGTVCGIGRLWQLDGWAADGAIQFRASSTREANDFAPKEVWTRREAAGPWSERMRLLGYAGSAANPLGRGVEGCIPGTLAQDMPASDDAADVELLQALIQQWREPALQPVRPSLVVPDFINREGTGVGVELVHFIALSIREQGFKRRSGTQGHDIPVVVREPPGSPFHEEALHNWKEKAAEDDGFPPVRISSDMEMFTSLGNGHFFQALNLYDCERPAINGNGRYCIGRDLNLAEAISQGVPSIILRHTTPRPVRAKIAQLLNSKREFYWNLQEDGTVEVSSSMKEDTSYCKQFECMSKFLDAVQVNSLVRTHLGINDSKRIQG